MKMNVYKFLPWIVLSFLLTSCRQFQGKNSNAQADEKCISVSNIQFDPSYKSFSVDIEIQQKGSIRFLEDNPQLTIKSSEWVKKWNQHKSIQPELNKIENILTKRISNLNMDILVVVDLTLSSERIQMQKEWIKKLRSIISEQNLYVAFIQGDTTTESLLATDYVLDNYFKPKHSGNKLLYRTILSKLEEMSGQQPTYFPKERQNTDWLALAHRIKALFIFSDGIVYSENKPIDKAHYDLQKRLVQVDSLFPDIPIFYLNFPIEENENTLDLTANNDSRSILELMCKVSNGTYVNTVEGEKFLSDYLAKFDMKYANYRLTFTNPDNKIYRGNIRRLQIDCCDGDSILMTGHLNYSLGSIYRPIIVNGPSSLQIVLKGCLLSVAIMLGLYLIFQFIIPYISYLIFKKKYVIRYKGENMIHNGQLIEQSCYFCKAPFEKGDVIVTKCSHVVHKECWDENEYKCPEYGRNCKHGRHYYNKIHLWDPHNASFYFAWIIAGVLAGLLAWICFTLYKNDNPEILINILLNLYDIPAESGEAKNIIDSYGEHLYYLPFYGLNISFFLTLFLSFMAGHRRWFLKRSLLLITKAVVAGICGYLSFLIGSIVSIVLMIENNSLFIDWIPWMQTGFFIAFIISFQTDIKRKRVLIGAFISIIFGLSSMYVWDNLQNALVDTRDDILLSYMIYCVGFAISIAITFPKSERYFLRVEGPIKAMDIAIYKWINAIFHNRQFTIGKSVNCDLQITWDLQSDIAPEIAEVKMKGGHLYLIALEEGVFTRKKEMKPNEKIRLYHGTHFRIGQTKFTYIERDI